MLPRRVSPNALFWESPATRGTVMAEAGQNILPCDPALGQPPGVIVRGAKRSLRCDCR